MKNEVFRKIANIIKPSFLDIFFSLLANKYRLSDDKKTVKISIIEKFLKQ